MPKREPPRCYVCGHVAEPGYNLATLATNGAPVHYACWIKDLKAEINTLRQGTFTFEAQCLECGKRSSFHGITLGALIDEIRKQQEDREK